MMMMMIIIMKCCEEDWGRQSARQRCRFSLHWSGMRGLLRHRWEELSRCVTETPRTHTLNVYSYLEAALPSAIGVHVCVCSCVAA